MSQVKTSLTLATIVCVALFGADVHAAKFKKWKDKDGNWQYGQTIPPEYAQQAHEEISNRGVVTDKTDRAMTKEELAAERAEKERQAALEAEEKRRAEAQAAKDRVLLDTFAHEDDIILTRDGKITNIDSDIALIEGRIQTLQKNLDEMISQAADDERAGKPPSEKITKDIASVRRQIAQNNDFIEKKHQEQEKIRQQYARDLERFRELKGE